MARQSKRIRGWCAVWGREGNEVQRTRAEAEDDRRAYSADRVARVVEVRKGEVVVDVERLVELLSDRNLEHEIRAAVRKARVR